MVSGDGRGCHCDGQIRPSQQQAAHVSGEDRATIGVSKVVDGAHHREGQCQRQSQEGPASQEFADDGLRRGDRHGQEQFEGAYSAFFGPQAHASGRHQKQVQPRVPIEEGARERGFTQLEEPAEHEGEEAVEQQEDDDKHVGHGRCKVAGELTFQDRPDVPKRFIHGDESLERGLMRGCRPDPAEDFHRGSWRQERLFAVFDGIREGDCPENVVQTAFFSVQLIEAPPGLGRSLSDRQ